MYADFIAGWSAGGTGLLLGHPLDTVKARLQTTNKYRGIIDCFVKTVANENVLGLYKGAMAPFLTAGALHSLLFAGYGAALRALHPGESNVEARQDLPMNEILLASMAGTLLQVGPVIPVELLKTKLQVQQESFSKKGANLYSGPLDCLRQTLRIEGVRGLFKGGWVIFCRDNIGYMFYIPVYEGIMRLFRKQNMDHTLVQVIAGGCAGITGWISVCPLEVVKNRMQADKSHKFRSVREVSSEIYRKEGIKAFYRGGLALSLRGFIVNAAIFVVYENVYLLM